jgi:glycosyltransferase involved in cell wall biosynthesis
LKIVFLNPSGRLGGAEVALLDLLSSIKDAESSWHLHLIVSEDGELAARAAALGVTSTLLPFPASIARLGDAGAGGPSGKQTGRLRLFSRLLWANGHIRAYVEQLSNLLCELRPDVIHSNGFKMHILGALAKPTRVPLIWHIHDYVTQRPFMVKLMRRFRKRGAIVLTNSESVSSDVASVCGSTLRVQTIYNGIDTKVFSPDGETLDLDQLSGLPPCDAGTIKVGLVATFARWKGHEVFLQALSMIPGEFGIRAYIIGDALYQTDGSQHSLAELKKLARSLGVTDRVGFTGFVAQPAAAMRSLDIVVHASTQPEPFGLVIVEGMACGRAVIVSEAGGATELFEHEVNALGHTPGDAVELAERIKTLAGDPRLRSRLGAAARTAVEQRFDRRRLAADLIPIYHEALALY